METLLSRYRNITVLLLVIFAQLVLLAYQVKNDSDVRVQKIIWSENVFTDLRDVHVRSHGSLKHRAGIV